jgi:Ni,Fe-hydrogenase III large subunit
MSALEWLEPAAFAARAAALELPLGAYVFGDGVHYLFLEPDGVVALSRRVEGERELPSLAQTRPLFSWDEREIADESGIGFFGAPDVRPFRRHDGAMPAAVVARGSGVMQIVVGPVHAGIIEPGRFTFSSGGENVVHLDAQLGYAYRGVEHALQGQTPRGAARFIGRICAGCSAARSYAYALALEQLGAIEIAPQVDLARAIVCELERLYNHLADLAASASAAGFGPGFARGMALKERAMRLCALASGHRLLFDAIVPGGVGEGVLRERNRVLEELAALAPAIEAYAVGLFANGSVVSRWLRAGIVPAETALAFGAVGPAHRGSGGTRDVRSYAPYGAYRSLGARAASQTGGDVFARCSVKRDELRESCRLLREALAALGDAPLPSPNLASIPAGAAFAAVEGARGTETIAVHVDDGGLLARVHAISASYRNWPVVARAMEGNIIPDFPLVNKSFNLCYACADR